MTEKLALALVALAACDTGLGSDPNFGQPACLPGHVRDANGCFVPIAEIAVDGGVVDWSQIPMFPIASTCSESSCLGFGATTIALASANDGDSDLYVRASFGVTPAIENDLEVGIALSPSAARPGSGGGDRVISTTSTPTLRYEKTGFPVVPASQPALLAFTGDGFEARINAEWMTYQGAAVISIIGLRSGADVVTTAPLAVCFGFHSGSGALDPHACEVAP